MMNAHSGWTASIQILSINLLWLHTRQNERLLSGSRHTALALKTCIHFGSADVPTLLQQVVGAARELKPVLKRSHWATHSEQLPYRNTPATKVPRAPLLKPEDIWTAPHINHQLCPLWTTSLFPPPSFFKAAHQRFHNLGLHTKKDTKTLQDNLTSRYSSDEKN